MNSSPFEASYGELTQDIDRFVDDVFANLASDFISLPKGADFIEYSTFEQGYELLKKATLNFKHFEPANVQVTLDQSGICFIVLRTILGFTPPELAHTAKTFANCDVPQGFARSLEGRIRVSPLTPLRLSGQSRVRVHAMIAAACQLIKEGASTQTPKRLHRLDKADTKHGLESLRTMAHLGAPYPVLLYERFLGRPFAAHRDAVSEIIGDAMEAPIEQLLTNAGISFRKTKRAERVPGFDQAPDFIIPNEFNPQAVIEAKICEDDGTARDKVTRVQHLSEISLTRQRAGEPPFEVIACISGRGFGVRREDMKKLLIATRGKVFTLKTLPKLIDHTKLASFRTL